MGTERSKAAERLFVLCPLQEKAFEKEKRLDKNWHAAPQITPVTLPPSLVCKLPPSPAGCATPDLGRFFLLVPTENKEVVDAFYLQRGSRLVPGSFLFVSAQPLGESSLDLKPKRPAFSSIYVGPSPDLVIWAV